MAVGALVGLVVAVPLTRLIESQLYGIAPHDGATLAAGLFGLMAAGALACDLPARRAARLDIARRAAERVSRGQDGLPLRPEAIP